MKKYLLGAIALIAVIALAGCGNKIQRRMIKKNLP